MVGTLPNVADFIREMAADKQAILAKAAQKKRQLQAFMAKEGDHHTNFNAKMIAVTPEQKQAYRVRNLQVDYQFAVRKLRQEMGLDRPHFASSSQRAPVIWQDGSVGKGACCQP